MEKSKLFTNAELKRLHERFNGSLKDKDGMYASRVKPKLIELLEWFKVRVKIVKLLETPKKKHK